MVTAAFVAVVPSQQASATVTWPQEFSDTGITQVVAHGDDNLTLLSCDYTSVPSTNAFTDVTDGVESSSYPQNYVFDCDPRHGNQPNNDITGPDGTVYGTHLDTSVSPSERYLVAANNGRIKWTSPLNDTSNCPGTTGYGTAGNPSSLSIGSDGNVYMIVTEGTGCERYLFAINSETGAQLTPPIDLGNAAGGAGTVAPSVWTYSDKIVAVDVNGEIHQYGYGPDYTEDTDAEYTFPVTDPDGEVMADAAGDVYLLTDSTIYFHGEDAINSSHAREDSGDQIYEPGPNGQLVAYYGGGAIYNFDMDQTTPTFTGLSPTIPSGYTKATTYYANPYLIEDTDGNVVETLQLTQNSTGYPAVDVVYIDASTDTTSSLYMRTGDSSSTGNAIAGQGDIYGDYMYLPVGYGTTTGSDSYVEKIDVASAGFGTAVRDVDGFDPGTDSSINYVAMGDSFSSGHGYGYYTPDSNVSGSGGDQCNRSNVAYAYNVAAAESLHLSAFVACSGATSTEMETTDQGEAAQVDSLSDSTDVVSVTAGGDDVGFDLYAEACVVDCDDTSTAFDVMTSGIESSSLTDSLEDLYQDILGDASSAQVYVLDYPYLASSGAGRCGGFDMSTAYTVETEINAQIDSAVESVKAENSDYAARLHFVETNYDGSPFSGHTLCDDDPYFNALSGANSLHPNGEGQVAYSEVLDAAIEADGVG